MSDPHAPLHRTGRGVDRLINFTDAVVAVAITLLVLPLVELRPEGDETFADVVAANVDQIVVFLFTFFLVGVLWLAHNRMLNGIRAYDGTLFWLNLLWLACIALLPWLSAQMGDDNWSGDRVDGSIGVAFWSVMGVASLAGAAMSRHLRRHPDLLEPAAAAVKQDVGRSLGRYRGLILGIFFLVLALLSWVAPSLAQWAPILIIPLSASLPRTE